MNRYERRLLFVFLYLFFGYLNSFGQTTNSVYDTYLENYLVDKHVPSISAGIMSSNKIIYLRYKGYRFLTNNNASTNNYLYRIASISKTITAVAVMQLVERKTIGLDDYVTKYLPEFKKLKHEFTIRQVLNHTSGFRGYKNGEFNSSHRFKNSKELMDYLLKDDLVSAPGTKYNYSTLAYNILGFIIERVTKKSFEEYVHENIFKPADMHNTFPEVGHENTQGMMRGYSKLKNGFVAAPYADLSIKVPGGGFISTAADILKFGNALVYGKLIKLSTLELMGLPTVLADGEKVNYGLGLAVGKDKEGNTYFHHFGSGTGFVSHLIIYPTEKIVAVHLINANDTNLDDPASKLLELYLTHYKGVAAVKHQNK